MMSKIDYDKIDTFIKSVILTIRLGNELTDAELEVASSATKISADMSKIRRLEDNP